MTTTPASLDKATAIAERLMVPARPAQGNGRHVEAGPGLARRQHGSPLLTLADLAREPIEGELVEDLIPESSGAPKIVTITSESGVGKSFAMLDLGLCVAQGAGFHGKRTQRGGVLYVAVEADALSRRVRALCQSVGIALDRLAAVPFQIRRGPLVLAVDPRDGRQTIDVMELRETIASYRRALADAELELLLFIVDTMRATMRGSENHDDVMAEYIGLVRSLLADVAPNTTGALVHHTGWMDGDAPKRRERGSSVIRGNIDAALYLERVGERQGRDQRLRLSSSKARDAGSELELLLIRRTVELLGENGETLRDRWGRPLTSCVIVDDTSGKTSAQHREDEQASRRARTRAALLAAVRTAKEPVRSQADLRALAKVSADEAREAIAELLAAGELTGGYRRPYVIGGAP